MAFLAPMVAGMSTMQMIAAGASAVSAIGSVMAGREQAKGYMMQASQASLKGKQDELKYKQQGIQVLQRINQNLASVTARAAGGSIDPYSGSPLSLKNYAQKAGTEEYYLALENAELQRVTGELNAQQYRSAAKSAVRQGWMNAISTVGMTAMGLGQIGGPAAGAGVNSAGSIAGVQSGAGWMPSQVRFSPGAVAL